MIIRFLKTAYDVFPIFNRPMAVCAVLSAAVIPFLYKYKDISLSLLVMFAVILVMVCIVLRSKKAAIISILFLAVCASAVNEFLTVNDLEALDGKVLNADFVATADSYDTGKVCKTSVYCLGSDVLPKKIKLSFYYFFDEKIKCGDTFNASVKLSSLEGSDYKMYNFGNSIYIDCKLLKINQRYSNNVFFEKIGDIRRYMIKTLSDRFPDDISSILIALNCGERKYLSDEFYNKVLICGVMHIMVVSGLHISIIIGSVFTFFEKIYYNKYLKCFISLILIFMICAVCGFTLSVIRAGVMFLFFVLSPLFMRKNDSLNSLGSAVVLILFLMPFSVYSVSFQLSAVATLAVVWISPYYCNLIISKLMIENRIARSIISVFTVSICALIFTAPITIGVFGTFAVLSPIAFMLITFPVTFALEFNTIALIMSAIKGISFLSDSLFWVAGVCARYIKYIIDNLGVLDFLLIKADLTASIIFLFLIIGMIAGMYLHKYYLKLLRRNFVSEVKNRGRNL
ncbi:MAG: ComEC/Rec2 family competence protein [Clostridia bacterium]|nr:ComEC/Rec2 family competence protein [Clostridia bacterium]